MESWKKTSEFADFYQSWYKKGREGGRERARERDMDLGCLIGEPGDAGEEPFLKIPHGHPAPVASVYAHYKSPSFGFLGI